ncbi:MAG TPA: helix-turn-helix domain-containing protein [Thermoanaerobaculia bacterium]|nr:helix-turn-helix domain-containing protein [Thermoanaerobaculia bacterium]
MSKTSGNKSKAAALLGITRQGLNLKLRRWRGELGSRRSEGPDGDSS